MEYRCAATSVEGFIQQLSCNYIPHGYWFYVAGCVPEGKCPELVDQKLTDKYQICISRQSRARRKQAGFSNLHYIRYERFFLLLATHGRHHFFNEEAKRIRDVRRAPIKFHGHSISFKQGNYLPKDAEGGVAVDQKWHTRVQIEKERYRELKAYFLSEATRRSCQSLGQELYNLPYEPYAPVRQQLLNLLRLINQARHRASLERLGSEVLRYKRRIVKPFLIEAPCTSVATLDTALALTPIH